MVNNDGSGADLEVTTTSERTDFWSISLFNK